MWNRARTALLLALAAAGAVSAQRPFSGTPELQLGLDRLNNTGRVLMIAAHPDDENTALLAWLARGRHVRAAYLSLTRGEGGQNLLGSEQGRLLGVIRTQELLEARRVDGAEQLFTSAIDFGFSKTAEESLRIWNREQILGEMVRVIREFQPHVIVTRFSGTPRDGHGQHQASAMLARDAFDAAADPARFPDQLRTLKPWRVTRLLWNAFAFTPEMEREAARLPEKLEIDVGEYNAALGYSYAEIAGISRSLHRSQAMGSPQRKGPVIERLVHVAGQAAKSDLLEGVDTGWPDAKLANLLKRARAEFTPSAPERIVPLLIEARAILVALPPFPGQRHKLRELEETVALAAGLWLDANAARPTGVPGEALPVTLTALSRSRLPFTCDSVRIGSTTFQQTGRVQAKVEPELRKAVFRVSLAGTSIEYTRPLHHRYIDRMYGEQTRPFAVVPPVSVQIADTSLVFPDAQPREISLAVSKPANVRLALPPGWQAQPLGTNHESVRFRVTPPASPSTGVIRAFVDSGPAATVRVIEYPHIQTQTVVEAAEARIVRADIKVLARNVGYIPGAGDEVPRALEQMGCRVTVLTPDDLAHGDLSRFDALMTGVRAYNVRQDLAAHHARLMDYVENGGTLVVQYNVLERGLALGTLGPYPITVGRDRVSVEEAPVRVLAPDSPLLNVPNRITDADFAGWVQERGLYFPAQWDQRYTAVIESHDAGEQPLSGGILFARHGKGAYVYTSYSWFRQLPAGVPGAFRIVANLLSAGQTTKP